MTPRPTFDPSSTKKGDITIRYIESLEARCERLERREKWIWAKMIGMWGAVLSLAAYIVTSIIGK